MTGPADGSAVPRVAFVTDDLCLEHDPGAHHPERPARVRAINRRVAKAPWSDRLLRPKVRDGTVAEALRVHDDAHVNRVLDAAGARVELDPDTVTSPGSVAAARRALGGALTAVERVLAGDADRAFASVRPPGHHATGSEAMGFCLFNNVAAAAAHALQHPGIDRVLIVDWDVHHGNGTEAIFADDDRVLFFSTHRMPFYPCTGHADTVHDGRTLNAPMPRGFSDAAVLYAFDALLAPAARRFEPDLIVVSAGYDAHADDPLGGCAVTDGGFGMFAGRVQDLATEHCGGRWVAVLEGGYDLAATARSAAATLDVMFGTAPPPPPQQPADGLIRGIISRTRAAARKTEFGGAVDWKSGG